METFNFEYKRIIEELNRLGSNREKLEILYFIKKEIKNTIYIYDTIQKEIDQIIQYNTDGKYIGTEEVNSLNNRLEETKKIVGIDTFPNNMSELMKVIKIFLTINNKSLDIYNEKLELNWSVFIVDLIKEQKRLEICNKKIDNEIEYLEKIGEERKIKDDKMMIYEIFDKIINGELRPDKYLSDGKLLEEKIGQLAISETEYLQQLKYFDKMGMRYTVTYSDPSNGNIFAEEQKNKNFKELIDLCMPAAPDKKGELYLDLVEFEFIRCKIIIDNFIESKLKQEIEEFGIKTIEKLKRLSEEHNHYTKLIKEGKFLDEEKSNDFVLIILKIYLERSIGNILKKYEPYLESEYWMKTYNFFFEEEMEKTKEILEIIQNERWEEFVESYFDTKVLIRQIEAIGKDKEDNYLDYCVRKFRHRTIPEWMRFLAAKNLTDNIESLKKENLSPELGYKNTMRINNAKFEESDLGKWTKDNLEGFKLKYVDGNKILFNDLNGQSTKEQSNTYRRKLEPFFDDITIFKQLNKLSENKRLNFINSTISAINDYFKDRNLEEYPLHIKLLMIQLEGQKLIYENIEKNDLKENILFNQGQNIVDQDSSIEKFKKECEQRKLKKGKTIPSEVLYEIALAIGFKVPNLGEFKAGKKYYQEAREYASRLGYKRERRMEL